MNIKISYYNPNSVSINRKATIHKTGKLGFTIESIKFLDFENKKYVRIGVNDIDKTDTSLYITASEENVENSFKISNAGKYVYLNTTALFDEIGLDYKNNKISFFITSFDQDGETVYKLTRKEKNRTKIKKA